MAVLAADQVDQRDKERGTDDGPQDREPPILRPGRHAELSCNPLPDPAADEPESDRHQTTIGALSGDAGTDRAADRDDDEKDDELMNTEDEPALNQTLEFERATWVS